MRENYSSILVAVFMVVLLAFEVNCNFRVQSGGYGVRDHVKINGNSYNDVFSALSKYLYNKYHGRLMISRFTLAESRIVIKLQRLIIELRKKAWLENQKKKYWLLRQG